MAHKTEGTGMLVDFKIKKTSLHKRGISKLTKKQRDYFTDYLNDGMGCPTEEINKPKATKLKRVK